MSNRISLFLALLAIPAAQSFAADDVVSAVHGTVTKVDSGAKTIAVKTADGTVQTFHYTGKLAVHGTEGGVKGVTEGSEVVAHYTVKGTDKTAVEVDKLGKGGLKETDGTVSSIDRGTKTIAVKTADGSVQTFKLADHATQDAGKDVAKGAEKSAKVSVYYTEDAGKKVVHFFETH